MPDDRLASLLASLNRVPGSLHLDCALVSEKATDIEKLSFPFVTVTDADPSARIIAGSIRTEAGSVLKEVFLLVQRDRYLLKEDPLRPFTNPDMEEVWRKTYRACERNRNSPPVHIVRPDAPSPAAFPPLLYCTRTRLFFPALCPKCKAVLTLCQDDELLTALGLQPYARSLKRYLHCADCAKTGIPVFYVYEREAADPAMVRDRFSLISDLSQVRGHDTGIGSFPCPGCPEQGGCYGPGTAAFSRIVPFSFYPFHLLIVEAPHLHGLDFLALAAGAPFGDLSKVLELRGERWRSAAVARLGQQCDGSVSFLSSGPVQRFFEVLFLKLSFLCDTHELLLSTSDPLSSTERGVSADRLWVKLGEPVRSLPFIWNFGLRFAGLRDDPFEGSSLPGLPTTNEFVSLGLLWFCALLVNGRQDMGAVAQRLREAARHRTFAEAMPADDAFSGGTNPFSPANIFWQPQGVRIEEAWRGLWERTLGLGWSLLRAAVSWDEQWLSREFRQQLESLMQEARQAVLHAAPSLSEEAVSPPAAGETEAIHRILMRIAGKWQAGLDAERSELGETVILSTTAFAAPVVGEPPCKAPLEESLAETVVLGPAGAVPADKGKVAAREVGAKEKAEAAEKKISPDLESPPSPKPRVDDALAETVIISRGMRLQPRPAAGAPGGGTADEGLAPGEQLTDTAAKPPKKPSADDDLAQTVMIDPAKLRPRK